MFSSAIRRVVAATTIQNGVRNIDTTGQDAEAQTRNVLDKIDTLLDQAGTDKSKLLTASIWLKNIERDFGTMNEVWLEWVDDENKPARATTEANLAFPHLLVEVQVSAAICEDSED